MVSGHTPGPWAVELDRAEDGEIEVVAAGGQPGCECPIALVDCRDYPEDELSPWREVALANARLIAAAPRMGELLLSAWQHVSHGGPTRADVEAVLREAGLLP